MSLLKPGEVVSFRVTEVAAYGLWGSDGERTYLALVTDLPEGSRKFGIGDLCRGVVQVVNARTYVHSVSLRMPAAAA
jgi:hypothetical protein